ncbi:MAG: flagellar protein FlgN [Gammaproteobacteria bacterium]|nr:flagellar protein FlgN [Gammaproteobacteria bacterium]
MADLTLHELLEKDLQNTVDLENLLRAERTQLEARDIGALSRTLIEKAEVLASIEQNDEARRKLLAQHGYPADNKGMRRFCSESPRGVTLYDQLREQIAQCAALTNINGAIVHRSRLNTRHVLDILRGKGTQSSLYTSAGSTNKTSETRALAKA